MSSLKECWDKLTPSEKRKIVMSINFIKPI
jgi:hypothetical protein